MTTPTTRSKADLIPVKLSVTPDGTRWQTFSDGSQLGTTAQGGLVLKGPSSPYLAQLSTKTSRPENPIS